MSSQVISGYYISMPYDSLDVLTSTVDKGNGQTCSNQRDTSRAKVGVSSSELDLVQ